MPYFFNLETQQSTWEPPAGLTQEQIDSLPGAHYLSGNNGGKVRASHLLVKHRDSRRPSSWKEVRPPEQSLATAVLIGVMILQEKITRTKEEAIEILRGYQKEINGSPEKFAELAKQYSDCSSHKNGGDLGSFGRVCMILIPNDALLTAGSGTDAETFRGRDICAEGRRDE